MTDVQESQSDDQAGPAIGQFPPRLETFSRAEVERSSRPVTYEAIMESICGADDDSQPVERYDGSLGVSAAFVDRHQRPVGQLQWDSDLADRYDNPGNVTGVRWCTGTLISHNLFLTAGHCFDRNPSSGWVVPRRDGTDQAISIQEIAAAMHVNFNYQADGTGELRTESEFEIDEVVEHELGGLDVAIVRLRGNPGATFGMGTIATTDPSLADMLAIIGHPAGVPKRIEAGPVTRYQDHRIRYDDIDTMGGNSGSAIWHRDSGTIVGIHTNGGCNPDGGSNFGVRIERAREESPTMRRLDHRAFPLDQGVYTVRQASSGRFLDAHEDVGNDFSAVTRTEQDNPTQRWRFGQVGLVVVARQVSSGRFLDAHEHVGNDFSAVTRTEQNNDTQKWVAMPVPGQLSTYTLQQLSGGRFLDAHVTATADFSVVTRTRQDNDTQWWRVAPLPSGEFTVSQVVNGRFLDAHENPPEDFSAVTRTIQGNDTQRWTLTPVGAVYEIEQASHGRKLDAHQNQVNDFSAVTRTGQGDDTQRWVATYLGGEQYTLQQLSSGRFLDAHESDEQDFSAVTRVRQDNHTQRWIIA